MNYMDYTDSTDEPNVLLARILGLWYNFGRLDHRPGRLTQRESSYHHHIF
jgi:hypothetical protein